MLKSTVSLLLIILIPVMIIAGTTSICPFSGKNDKTYEICCRIGETLEFRIPGQVLAFRLDNAKNWLCSEKDNFIWIQPRFASLNERLHIFSRYNSKIWLFSFKLIEGGGMVVDTIDIKVIEHELQKSYN